MPNCRQPRCGSRQGLRTSPGEERRGARGSIGRRGCAPRCPGPSRPSSRAIAEWEQCKATPPTADLESILSLRRRAAYESRLTRRVNEAKLFCGYDLSGEERDGAHCPRGLPRVSQGKSVLGGKTKGAPRTDGARASLVCS